MANHIKNHPTTDADGDLFGSVKRIAVLETELADCKAKLAEWVKWFEKTGDGSMSGLSDSEYHEALCKWIEEGYLMSMETV